MPIDANLRVRILDLDGGVTAQTELLRAETAVHPVQSWGPRIRMACSFGRFRAFERALADQLGGATDADPQMTFYGSGDFHHVSLALVRRLTRPVNLLVLDNHPDWMAGIPFLHCGTWLHHALRLPQVARVFHVGGEVDFDNSYRWLAPWKLLREGRVVVLPAVRRFKGRHWSAIPHAPLRPSREAPADRGRVEELLRPYRDELARRPLYISFDKDVMTPADAVVNWDSGFLNLDETTAVLDAFTAAAGGRLAGMDVTGDWSPVRVAGWFRTMFHLTEHPALAVDPDEARRCNERTNGRLLSLLKPRRAGSLVA
jgi:arginase family enzyme